MARTKDYKHFCAAARTLEVVGEKWSLLIVRDLLGGPSRFSDLLVYLGSITPKWLTLRLRDLEAAGIVERDAQEGRREVRYRLTGVGRDLGPVVESLVVWGMKHAMRPPLLGESVHPKLLLHSQIIALNNRLRDWPAGAVTWVFKFGGKETYTFHFDGQQWSLWPGEQMAADVKIETRPESLANFLCAPPSERRRAQGDLAIDGHPERVAEFASTFFAPRH